MCTHKQAATKRTKGSLKGEVKRGRGPTWDYIPTAPHLCVFEQCDVEPFQCLFYVEINQSFVHFICTFRIRMLDVVAAIDMSVCNLIQFH